jgi:hypothetical protein
MQGLWSGEFRDFHSFPCERPILAESGGRRLRIALFGLAIGILHVLPPQNVWGSGGIYVAASRDAEMRVFFYSRGATLRT